MGGWGGPCRQPLLLAAIQAATEHREISVDTLHHSANSITQMYTLEIVYLIFFAVFFNILSLCVQDESMDCWVRNIYYVSFVVLSRV